MKKTDKKTDQALVASLTKVCDEALQRVPGFVWITHFVKYDRFPGSLRVVAVLETDDQLLAAEALQLDKWLLTKVSEELAAVGITLRDKHRQFRLDTEQACQREHQGNWQQRYR